MAKKTSTIEKPIKPSTNDNQYLDELHKNINEDRSCLVEFRSKLLTQVEKISNLSFADADEDGIDSEKKKSFMMVQLADGIARISDCLSKSSQQLVEIIKLTTKKSNNKAKDENGVFTPGSDIFEHLDNEEDEVN